jgi:hypothetical protein
VKSKYWLVKGNGIPLHVIEERYDGSRIRIYENGDRVKTEITTEELSHKDIYPPITYHQFIMWLAFEEPIICQASTQP